MSKALDETKENRHSEYLQIKDLLTEDEYEIARASTLNAHYTKAKADMFTKHTMKKSVKTTRVNTPSKALAVSVSEKAKIDMAYRATLTGKTKEQLVANRPGFFAPLRPARAGGMMEENRPSQSIPFATPTAT